MKNRSNFFQFLKPTSASVFIFIVIIISAVNANGFDLKTESLNKTLTLADGDTVVVKSVGADLSYDVTEIRAEAGSTLTIRYENRGEMPHNIVLVNERADINPVGVAALQAMNTDYIPQGESLQERIIAHTALAKPGDTVFLTITVPPPGTYPYICTYPGHFTMMQGDLISE